MFTFPTLVYGPKYHPENVSQLSPSLPSFYCQLNNIIAVSAVFQAKVALYSFVCIVAEGVVVQKQGRVRLGTQLPEAMKYRKNYYLHLSWSVAFVSIHFPLSFQLITS